ncbi:TonB-dependent receptor plug domain-containing protein [Shewanella sp. KX20019]|uniref:TonB-dependent receptor domain-containing protein n=1 Tax=Shewanella sp. KX20019 TaxID=2803864 RepID=UPI001927DA4D|nr:TonB-dependent receptor [Shewanella sp. KX20019]QQX80456.1 TonB-dependent receptor plug domain-containing protein [Shewanella sp. KX20019]
MMKSTILPSLLAASIGLALYGPQAVANDVLPVLAETETQSVDQADGLLIEREQIKAKPVNNSSLSQLLKTQPGIAINDATGSVRGGDLAPEEISLANARPHQTNYMIGGVTTNNISTFGANDTAGGLGGHTSGYFFDTELLESVEVMDRNVGAEYGSFTGGIINAELRKPTDEFTAEYSFKMTDSDWNSDPTLDEDNGDLEAPVWGDGRYQDQYQKRFHNLFVGGAINENHKLGIGISLQESDIPLIYNGERKDQGQTNTNVFINHLATLGAWEMSNELRFSEFTDKRFLNDTFTDETDEFSDYENSSSGIGYTLKLDREFAAGMWRNTVAFDQLKNERSADVNYFKTHFDYRTGFDMGSEGSYGNLDETQNSSKLKSVFDFNALYTGAIRHQVSMGVDVTLHSAEGTYQEDFHTFTQYSNADGTVELDSWTTTVAGDYKADANQYALFATDTIEWNKLTVNLGLRAEHMELFDQTVLAPRISSSWDFETDNTNRLTVGASRYYSGSLLGWALSAEKRALQTNRQDCVAVSDGNNVSLDPNDYSCESTKQYQATDLNQADTPYSDEISLNYDLQFGNVVMNAGYLYRQQRDGLSSIYNSELGYDELHNNMESDSNIYSLRFSNADDYSFLGGKLGGYLDLGYVDAKGSGSTSSVYDSQNDLNGGSSTEWVMLDGELMRRTEMEAGSYNSDFTAGLAINANWEQYGVMWSNFINYESGRNLTLFQRQESHEIDGEMTGVAVMSSAEMESLVTWDTKVSWTPTMADERFTLSVSVTNLLDKQVKISTSGIEDNSKFTDDYYNQGRQVWLSVSARL